MHNMAQFRTNFLDLFEKLASDKVVNVRISVAKVLLRHFEQQSEASKDQRIRAMYSLLLKDHSADVVKILKKEHTIIDEVISSSSSDVNQSRNSQQEESAGETHPNDEVAPAGENILPPNFTQEGVVLPQKPHEEPITKLADEPATTTPAEAAEEKTPETKVEPVEEPSHKVVEDSGADQDKNEPAEVVAPEVATQEEQKTGETPEETKLETVSDEPAPQEAAETKPVEQPEAQPEETAATEPVIDEPAQAEAQPQEGDQPAPEEQA